MFCREFDAVVHVVNRSLYLGIVNRDSNNEAHLKLFSLRHKTNLHYVMSVTLVKHILQSNYANSSFKFHLKHGADASWELRDWTSQTRNGTI